MQPEFMRSRKRVGLIEILSGTRHLHLFQVEYPIVAEWVYNDASIDDARVTWARSRTLPVRPRA